MSTSKEAESLSLPRDRLCQHFSIEEIRSATKNFDEALVVGRGGFGKVYKGPIKNGANTVAAFKRLHSGSNQGETEFWGEIEMLSELRHCHLVSLIGYCNEGQEMILVYEYMAHGTVEDHLHKAGGTRLTWLQRLKICIGAARGLDYLHTGTGTHHGVIHRDVKSSNILLDESWSAKISDFGLSKIGPTNQTRTYVSTGVKGTFGYMDPIYFSTARLTRKSDVYSFGVVLFEVLCGRPVVDISLHEEQWGLAGWVQECIKKGKLGQIVDSSLSGQIMPSCLKEYARIAARCLHSNPNQRPTMAEIVAKLEFALSLQERMNSSATKWAFRGKVWSIFSAKSHLKSYIVSAHSTASRGEPSDKAGEKSVDPPVSTVGSGVEQTHKDKRYFFHFYDDALSFTIEDLLRASAEIISRGTYWNAYMAVLGDDINVLVKRKNNGWVQEELYKNNGWVQEEFYTEVAVLGSIRHTNILALKACYSSKDELLCISQYMPNGSVASFLHSSGSGEHKPAISWSSRMNIIVGITRGLVYLHTHENLIIHGNLTSSNVLLDKEYNPLISDVGLSRLSADAKVPNLYNHAPELFELKNASTETDVYGLGVIILELLTGKSTREKLDWLVKPTKKETEFDLLSWVNSICMEDSFSEVFDPEVLKEEPGIEDVLINTLRIALRCLDSSPKGRPNAQQVLDSLDLRNC